MEGGYAWCLNKWALDKNIDGELGLLLIISSFCANNGCCYASNEYLASLFDLSTVSISRKINKLKDLGYIKIEYEKRGAEVKKRIIRLTDLITDDYQKCYSTINKNDKEIITSNINTSINNKENIKRKVFKKPTIPEIQKYCEERNNSINAEAFYDFYESKNWLIGKSKMADWKACIRTWEKRNSTKETEYKTKRQVQEDSFRKVEEEFLKGE